jgi:hypothetical protein
MAKHGISPAEPPLCPYYLSAFGNYSRADYLEELAALGIVDLSRYAAVPWPKVGIAGTPFPEILPYTRVLEPDDGYDGLRAVMRKAEERVLLSTLGSLGKMEKARRFVTTLIKGELP